MGARIVKVIKWASVLLALAAISLADAAPAGGCLGTVKYYPAAKSDGRSDNNDHLA